MGQTLTAMVQAGTIADAQTPFDAAVVIPTVLRPSLIRAVESVFAQDFPGRVQVLIGVDVASGDRAMIETLSASCPGRMILTVLELPYSTSARHGGLYPNRFSGALRTILTYAANSRYVAYLDDDNWWAPDHLASLKAAIDGVDWAFSRRIFVEAESGEGICPDDWESVGPGAGVFLDKFGGFVDPSSLMIDKLRCHDVVPLWSQAAFEDGSGEDRLVFAALKDSFRFGDTGRATSYYSVGQNDAMHAVRLEQMRERGIVLPADRRAGRRNLTDAVAGLARGVGEGAEPPSAPLVLREIVARLKPRDIVVLGAGDGAAALTIARLVAGDALIVAADQWTGDEHRAAVARLGKAALALPGDGLAFLAARLAQADLIYLARPDFAELHVAWNLVRGGGLLLGSGAVTPSVRDFAAQAATQLLPTEIDGLSFWIAQKT